MSRERALAEKDEGNKLFLNQQFPEAIEKYEKALNILADIGVAETDEEREERAKILCNRSAAHLKGGKAVDFELAAADADAAVAIAPKFLKGFLRRGLARMALHKYKNALEDFKHLVQSGNNSLDVIKGVEKCRNELGLPPPPKEKCCGGKCSGCPQAASCGGCGKSEPQAAPALVPPGDVIHIKNDGEFVKYANVPGYLIAVDFSATWCPPCKMISPVFEKMAKQPENSKVFFLKVDIDEVRSLAQHYSVSSVPTFIFFKDGQLVSRFAGAQVALLKQTVEQHQ